MERGSVLGGGGGGQRGVTHAIRPMRCDLRAKADVVWPRGCGLCAAIAIYARELRKSRPDLSVSVRQGLRLLFPSLHRGP
ncbi:hypothetical protein BVI434_2240038 [Burkholderia vietnamiensis]|nr:hypothetical protein BVI434_2240038 [Burkholderia vietnamiensis]